MPLTGRRPVTPEQFLERVHAYCRTYGVEPNAVGLPPFPTGQRETPQHRAWLGLYKTHQRLRLRSEADAAPCPVCLGTDSAHADCRALLQLARTLGPDALERVRAHLWP